MKTDIQLTFASHVLNQINLDQEVKVPQRLRKLREKNGFTMEQVAKAINIKRQTYNGYEAAPEKAYHRAPSYDKLMKLAELYNVSCDYLIGLTDNPAQHSAAIDVMEILEKDASIDKNTRQYITTMLREILNNYSAAAV